MSGRCTVLSLWLLAVVPAWAEPLLVRELRIEPQGPVPVDRELVLAHCRTKIGEPWDQAAVAADVRRLLGTGRFTEVNAWTEPLQDGVALIFRVRAKWKLAEVVHITGRKLPAREGKLRELIGLAPGDFVDEPTLAARLAKVREKYPDVPVTGEVVPLDPDQGTAKATVEFGATFKRVIRSLRFVGQHAESSLTLRALLLDAWKWNVVRWARKPRYDETDLQAGCERIRQWYKSRGFLDIKVSPELQPVGDGRAVAVVVHVEEGPQYRVEAVGLSGVGLYPEAELMRQVELKLGEPLSGEALDRACANVREYYESRGYRGTVVRPALEATGVPGRVRVTLAVREGRLTHIRNVLIRGNTLTKDRVIRRELLVLPGERYDGVRIRRSERRLGNLGYFASVLSYDEPTDRPGESDLVFEVEEQRTGQFSVSAAFSELDQLMGIVEVGLGNFDLGSLLGPWPPVGGGQKANLRATVGTRVESYALEFIEPWLLDRPLALSFRLYSDRRDLTDYDVHRLGGAVGLGMPAGPAGRVDLTYRLEEIDVDDIADTNLFQYVENDQRGEVFSFVEPERVASSLSVKYTLDTRNRVFLATRGWRWYAAGKLMGGPLGCDIDLYDLQTGGSLHFPLWFGHVLSFWARAEVVDSYGDTEQVPVTERLFAGGGQTVRGFRPRWVGPKAQRTDAPEIVRPAGGQSLAVASVEYEVPLEIVRLSAFYDRGNVWYDAYDFDLGNTAAGAGVGVLLDIQGFPFRIDYAWPVERDDPRSKTKRVSFSIGHRF